MESANNGNNEFLEIEIVVKYSNRIFLLFVSLVFDEIC